MIQIKIIYLGGTYEETKCEEELFKIPKNTTIFDLEKDIIKKHPTLKDKIKICRIACNYEFVDHEHILQNNDEVALIPPVSGGNSMISLTKNPIHINSVFQKVSGDTIGATNMFIGTVRKHSRNKDVLSLTYTTYKKMAEIQLNRIAQEYTSDTMYIAITHRYGNLKIGDISIVIAVASKHRKNTFQICEKIIERIKKDLTIWKKEKTTDGDEWIGFGGG